MRREEVSFLQAHCEMERLRDGQMTMAGRPGPESRLGAGGRPTPCYVLAPAAALSAPSRGLRRRVFFWQGDPLRGPLFPSTFHPLLPVLPASPPPRLPPFVDTQPGGDELTQRVQTSLGALSRAIIALHLF